MTNDMSKLLDENPDQPMLAYLAASFAWNNGWPGQNQRLIDTLAPLGFVIEGGPKLDMSKSSHPSLDAALKAAAQDPAGHAALVEWIKEGQQANGGHKNPDTYIPLMMQTEAGRAQLARWAAAEVDQ